MGKVVGKRKDMRIFLILIKIDSSLSLWGENEIS